MYKINEQEDPWAGADAAIQQATKSKSTSTGKVTTPPKSGGDADAAKRAKDAAALKAKQDAERKSKEDAERRLKGGSKDPKDRNVAIIAKKGWIPLITSSVEFLQKFGAASRKRDTDLMYNLIKQYIIRNNTNSTYMSCVYIDWILRLSTPGSIDQKLAMKFQKQYNYALSSNGLNSISVNAIFNMPKDPSLKNINSIFNPQQPIGKMLDMSSDNKVVAEIRSNIYGVINYIENNTSSKFEKPRSAAEFHEMIMRMYELGSFNLENKSVAKGKMLPKFKTKF
jgi:hypothetical protein